MSGKSGLVAVLLCWLLLGCAGKEQGSEQVGDDVAEDVFALPATFIGEIPCVDCLRVDIVLNLRPDSLYQLRKTYHRESGAEKVEAQMGKWRYSPEGDVIILGKEKGLLKTYRIVDEEHLRFVGWEGADDDEQISYELTHSPDVDPFEYSVKMRAVYRITGDRTEVVECDAGNVFPVAPRGDYHEMAQVYLNMPHPYGKELLASFFGTVVDEDGHEAIVIDRFNRFYPNQDCEGNVTRDSLTGTYWRLLEIDGQEVPEDQMMNVPFLLFRFDKTMDGFGGCNRLAGSFLVQGDVFLINRALTTRVACSGGMELENSVLRAIDDVETYRISDGVLSLLNQYNQVRLRLLAGP